MIVNLNELDASLDYLNSICKEKLEDIVWKRGETVIPVTDDQRSDYRFIGLSNVEFPWVAEIEGQEEIVLSQSELEVAQKIVARNKILQCFDLNDLVMSATAYYLGRMTHLVDSHCDAVVKAWTDLPTHVRDYIQRIVDEAFSRHEIVKTLGKDLGPLGNNCDRESWEKVRACWSKKTEGKAQ